MHKASWIFTMAWRDFRKSSSRLVLFVAAMVLGVAAIVAIYSFGQLLRADIARQGKELLGADLVLSNNRPLDSITLESQAQAAAAEVNFASMVAFPKTGESRLTQVRALEGDFPFYGRLETLPEAAEQTFRAGGAKALVEKTLMAQFSAQVGDSIQVGNQRFRIEGLLEKVPGQTGITATVAPAVYIPMAYVEETGLIQYGSRLNYVRYFQFAESVDVAALVRENDQAWESERIQATTVSESQNRTGRAFDNLAGFLSLVAFIALLLGCVGVGSAVNVFIKEKLASVAVLRCLGVSAKVATLIYLVQILLMGSVGAFLGSALGTALQLALPYVLGDFLPVEVRFGISWSAIGLGMLTGVVVSVLFALLPLLKIRRVSPMATLRPEMQEAFGQDPLRYLVVLAILAFVYGFSYFLLSNYLVAVGFTAFVCGAFLLLWGLATLLMKSIRRFLPISFPYTLRQALANLYRPNNQTVALIATVGLGTAMISTLIFVQTQLLEEVKFADRGDQPNMLLFDIQTHQVEAVRAKLERRELPILQQVPIVTMGLEAINGVSRKQNDTLPEEERRSRSLYNREFRVTYRDTLISSERLTAGKLRPYASTSDTIFVSVDESYARRTGLEMGDRLDFNVQGRPLRTYVGSLREVKFNQVSTNFLVLFPEGVLANAPKFHVLITKTKDEFEAAAVQAEVVREYPNISMVNLGSILETLEEVLGKISLVIRFMALFSIATGILVLISSLVMSKYQRLYESILLRTLGASSTRVAKIQTLEYFFLGSLAALSGVFISLIASYLLSVHVFQIPFRWTLPEAFLVYAAITGLTVMLGWLNGRTVKDTAPIAILRG